MVSEEETSASVGATLSLCCGVGVMRNEEDVIQRERERERERAVDVLAMVRSTYMYQTAMDFVSMLQSKLISKVFC